MLKDTHPPLKTIFYSGTMRENIWFPEGTKPDDFISKPFHFKRVLEAVRTVLGGR